MAVYVMLTVDLNKNVSEDARAKFYEKLKQEKWQKLKLTTTWHASFDVSFTKQSALQTTKSDVAAAAAVAGIRNYEAAAEAGDEPPTSWSVGN